MPDETPVKLEEKAPTAAAKLPEIKTASDVSIGAAISSRFPKYFAIGFAILFIIFIPLEIFQDLEHRWTGQMFRMRGMEPIDNRITVVAIDDASLKEIGVYPWPRGVYAGLLDKLVAHGIKVIGFDVLFFEASGKPKEDAKFIKATRRYQDKIVHAMRVSAIPGSFDHEYVYPFKELKDVTKHFGNVVQHLIDKDGQVREMVVTTGKSQTGDWEHDPDRVPSLGIAMLGIYNGTTIDDVIEKVDGIGMALNIRGEEVIKRWSAEAGKDIEVGMIRGIPRISASDVLNDEIDEDMLARLKGGIVFVGLTASGGFDHYPSPFSEQAPGVEVHATMVDNLLNDRWVDQALPIVTIFITILMILCAYRLVLLAPLKAASGLIFICIGWTVFVYYSFLNLMLIEFVPPILAFVSTFLVLIIHRTMLEAQQKAEVRQMFGQYVAPEVVDLLVKNPGEVPLGGVKRDMTIFFLDIAHFTSISEKMTPEALINFLNLFLTPLSDNILDSGGVVDKYIGDCVMAFWNAPLDVKGHRGKACLAALKCVETVKELNKLDIPDLHDPVVVRIGLNSGDATVGNTGSVRKLAYTVLGDNVNLSSRLEGANKFFGSTIMASEDTYDEEASKLVEARELGKVRVVGKEIPIKVFELLAEKGKLDESWQKALPIYHEGVQLYNDRKFEEAKAKFEEVLKSRPDDKPTKLYINLCEDYIVIPPSPGLELVFNLTSK